MVSLERTWANNNDIKPLSCVIFHADSNDITLKVVFDCDHPKNCMSSENSKHQNAASQSKTDNIFGISVSELVQNLSFIEIGESLENRG